MNTKAMTLRASWVSGSPPVQNTKSSRHPCITPLLKAPVTAPPRGSREAHGTGGHQGITRCCPLIMTLGPCCPPLTTCSPLRLNNTDEMWCTADSSCMPNV